MKDCKLIFSELVDELNLTFNYIDIGARGDIASPWLELEENSTIYGFEPDINEAKRLTSSYKNRVYFGTGLWSKRTKRKLYINENEPTSSMYPPNTQFIQDFEPQHWVNRKTKSIVEVQCEKPDTVLEENGVIPDFIKIDTQGAELEILKGSESILREYHPMVTAETWCAEVYEGAPMMHEVIEYMHSLGYQIFRMELAAAWRHNTNSPTSRMKSIGYEILFVKLENELEPFDDNSFVKLLMLLELYGNRDYALHLLDRTTLTNSSLAELLREKLIENEINQRNMQVYPKIKY